VDNNGGGQYVSGNGGGGLYISQNAGQYMNANPPQAVQQVAAPNFQPPISPPKRKDPAQEDNKVEKVNLFGKTYEYKRFDFDELLTMNGVVIGQDQYILQQAMPSEQVNSKTFAVQKPNGDILLAGEEESGICTSMLFQTDRPFTMQLGLQGTVQCILRKEGILRHRISIYIKDEFVGIIKKRFGYFGTFQVHDRMERPVYELVNFGSVFTISEIKNSHERGEDDDKNNGAISRRLGDIGFKHAFFKVGSVGILFPKKSNAEHRLLFIAAGFLLHYLYFLPANRRALNE